jgi:hypothetical protein
MWPLFIGRPTHPSSDRMISSGRHRGIPGLIAVAIADFHGIKPFDPLRVIGIQDSGSCSREAIVLAMDFHDKSAVQKRYRSFA